LTRAFNLQLVFYFANRFLNFFAIFFITNESIIYFISLINTLQVSRQTILKLFFIISASISKERLKYSSIFTLQAVKKVFFHFFYLAFSMSFFDVSPRVAE
jgi:hypothetical protein